MRNYNILCFVEQVKGIEPSSQAWEARILPMNYTCGERKQTAAQAAFFNLLFQYSTFDLKKQRTFMKKLL